MTTRLDWYAVLEQLPPLGKGLVFTLEISASGYALSLVVGLVVALMRRSRFLPLSGLAFAYTQFFRSISIYIYIIWVYFGIPVALGVRLSPFAASVVSLLLLHSAYMSEIYRAALDAVDLGQREAAQSLGLGRIMVFFEVVLPQALRIALPQLINQFTMILKDSSVVALIGAGDLMHETIRAANREFRSFEFYTTAGLIYLSIVLIVSGIASLIEHRMRLAFS
jgi:His/Glu/Gln/Arg/opine family amino acid ABC transporter permease subunit